MTVPKNYDALNHFIYITTFDDVTFSLEGEQDGDFLSIVFDNDSITGAEGAKGDVQWSQRQPSLGTIVFTGQWGSDFNQKLNQVHKDQIAGNPPKKLQVKRISGTENTLIYDTGSCRIMKTADQAIGSVANPRAWSIKVGKLTEEEVAAPA